MREFDVSEHSKKYLAKPEETEHLISKIVKFIFQEIETSRDFMEVAERGGHKPKVLLISIFGSVLEQGKFDRSAKNLEGKSDLDFLIVVDTGRAEFSADDLHMLGSRISPQAGGYVHFRHMAGFPTSWGGERGVDFLLMSRHKLLENITKLQEAKTRKMSQGDLDSFSYALIGGEYLVNQLNPNERNQLLMLRKAFYMRTNL